MRSIIKTIVKNSRRVPAAPHFAFGPWRPHPRGCMKKTVVLLSLLLLLLASCAKKQPVVSQDMAPNLDPELAEGFLKIQRPRPLTEAEKKALSYKTAIPFNLDVKETEDLQMYFAYFTQEKRDTMVRWLERAEPHLPYIRAVLATYGLPPDIIALPFIESGYNTMAYSHAGAGGMWQFMPATGRRFGLNVDWWEDERRNPYLATIAAAKYLSALHEMFGDWNLALASYNCGEGKMSRVMAQSGQSDFYDIAKNPNLLKEETRKYVPKFLAVLKIFKNLETLGFKPVNWNNGLVLEEVQVNGMTDLAAMAEACGMSWEEFHRYNSSYRRQVSPPDKQSPVYVPQPKKELALAYVKNPSCVASRGLRQYPTGPSDSWWTLSKRTGVPVAALRQMNPSLGDAIVPGAMVMVALDGSAQDTALADLDDRPAKSGEIRQYTNYKVKKGDTLAALSKHYGVSQSEILKASRLKYAKEVTSGRMLVIPAGSGSKIPAQACPPVAPGKSQVAEVKEVRTVEVKKGLTLAALASANKVDPKALMAANGLKSEKDLKVGMRLSVPAPTVAAAGVAIPYAHAATAATPPAHAKGGKEAKGVTLAAMASNAPTAPGKADSKSHGKEAQTKQSAGPQKAASTPKESKDAKKTTAVQYHVANGETVWSIARKFKVDPHSLLSWNNLNDKSQLRPGDKLKIHSE